MFNRVRANPRRRTRILSDETKKEEAAAENEEAAPELSDEKLEGASGGHYKVTFNDLVISSFQTGGSAGGASEPEAEDLISSGESNDRDADDPETDRR